MGKLVPEPRQDKNGNIVTRWLRKGKSVVSREAEFEREIERRMALKDAVMQENLKYRRMLHRIQVIEGAGQEYNIALEQLLDSGDYSEASILEVVTTYRTSHAEQIRAVLNGEPVTMSDGIL